MQNFWGQWYWYYSDAERLSSAAGFTGGMETGFLGVVAIALAFGLAIVASAYAIGDISGCHVNPAVSLAMLINGKLTFGDFIGYVIAQVAGAFAGSAF